MVQLDLDSFRVVHDVLESRGMAIKVLVVHVNGQRTAVDPVKTGDPSTSYLAFVQHAKSMLGSARWRGQVRGGWPYGLQEAQKEVHQRP